MTIPLTPAGGPEPAAEPSFYEAIGGHATFVALVDRFYEGVVTDPVLRPMYPEAETDPTMPGARERLTMFLEQYWGGPDTYNAERGHPRLRMRHHPFVVDMAARDRWLELMALSLADVSDDELPKPHRDAMWEHMVRVADMLINKPA